MIRWARKEEAQSDVYVNFCREHSIIPYAENVNRFWEYPWAYFQGALRPGMRVLDAGAGNSPFISHLQNRVPGCEFHAADPSFQYQKPVQLQGVVTSSFPVEGLEYPDGYFDVSFSLSVLEHLSVRQQIEGMRHLARCTKPGGRVVLTVDYFLDWPSWKSARACNPDWHAWLPETGNIDLAALISSCGLEVFDETRVDAHPGWEGFNDAVVDTTALWFSTHVKPDLRVTAVGVVLYKPMGREGERFTISPESLYLKSNGLPLFGIHRGAGNASPTARYELPRAALDDKGFTPDQFRAWLGGDMEAEAVLRHALRWGALVPAEQSSMPTAVYQPESFIEHYGGQPRSARRGTKR
ncbi:class I SAM-dependent methyltransferase [Streptomyces sp. NPDC102381]|uniref:class I SAM-dependent methyltransferase n=1 Tax=Streptomyces sp. NPDC102381 TaxID=3366164 RepID=UPI0038146C30